jgi:hypothetical protein
MRMRSRRSWRRRRRRRRRRWWERRRCWEGLKRAEAC